MLKIERIHCVFEKVFDRILMRPHTNSVQQNTRKIKLQGFIPDD